MNYFKISDAVMKHFSDIKMFAIYSFVSSQYLSWFISPQHLTNSSVGLVDHSWIMVAKSWLVLRKGDLLRRGRPLGVWPGRA